MEGSRARPGWLVVEDFRRGRKKVQEKRCERHSGLSIRVCLSSSVGICELGTSAVSRPGLVTSERKVAFSKEASEEWLYGDMESSACKR